jgi:flagellar basal-body rod protein FlgC
MAGVLKAIEISSEGLTVQRRKMNVVAENIANAETTQTPEGGPYRRKRVEVKEVKEPGTFDSFLRKAQTPLARTNPEHRMGLEIDVKQRNDMRGVKAKEIQDPASDFKLVYDPSNPDADADGYVKMPDIEIINEMVDMMASSRAYEANTTAISTSKTMTKNALDI